MKIHNNRDAATLLAECTKDIRWEFHQLRTRITTEEIKKLAEALFHNKPIDWPFALVELQKGIVIKRLLTHLNFHVRKSNLPTGAELKYSGPFPAFSLMPLKAKADEQRTALRIACCIELIGNKAWDYALKPLKKRGLPLKVKVATLALKSCGCSPQQQTEASITELTRHIQGYIINFLYEWEALLVRQTQEQLVVYKQDSYLSIGEAAV